MGIFIKISLWIITILLLAIALPFFPSVASILLILAAFAVVPLQKVEDLRARIFTRKKNAAEVPVKRKLEFGQAFVNIGPWDIPADEYINTAARYERGLQIEPERIGKINRAEGSVEIMGSEGYAYNVSLAGCECIDYQRRGLPCKHMLRLAHDLGEEVALPVFDPSANSDYDPAADIELLTQRWKAGQITTDAYKRCLKALQASSNPGGIK